MVASDTAFEDPLVPVHRKPYWPLEAIKEIQRLGLTPIDGRLLRDLAAKNKAKRMIEIVRAAKVIKPACSDKFWQKWLSFAQSRVEQSADTPCGLEFLTHFKEPMAISNGDDLPIVLTIRMPGMQVDLHALAHALRPGSTVH